MPIFAVTAALPGQAPEMLAAAGEVRSGADDDRMEREDLLALVEGVGVTKADVPTAFGPTAGVEGCVPWKTA